MCISSYLAAVPILILKFVFSQAVLLRLPLHVDCRQEGNCPAASVGPKFRVSYFNMWPKSHVFENKVCKIMFVLQREEVSIEIGVRTWTEFS
jgi:hypothetical protein